MKTKLTLTVKNEVINKARKHSKAAGKSISQLFEEFIQNAKDINTKSESQIAAERLLKKLATSAPVKTLNDKSLLKKHIARKYA